MRCPKCGERARRIKQVEHIDDVSRTYVCKVCGYEFRTTEIDEDMYHHMAVMAGDPSISTWEHIILRMADKCDGQERCETCDVYRICQKRNLQLIWREALDEIDSRRRKK